MKKDHVVVLLEQMQSDVKLVLESHAVLRDEMHGLYRKLDQKIDDVQGVLEAKIQGVHDKLDAKIDAVHDKLDAKIDAVRDQLDAQIRGVAADLAAHRADTESQVAEGYDVRAAPSP